MEVRIIASEEGNPPLDERVRRAKAGDFAAFEELYRLHAGRVYALCLRMTAEPARAEDLTQDAFVSAWEKLGSYRGESEFAAWLRRLAINTVLMDRRSRSRKQDRESAAENLLEFPQPESRGLPATGLDLEHAIAALPQRARAVFVLHDVEGYRHEEIARMLGVAVGTTKTQLHRARKLLREALRS